MEDAECMVCFEDMTDDLYAEYKCCQPGERIPHLSCCPFPAGAVSVLLT